jgi:Asp/Glu/hydantoin racemase
MRLLLANPNTSQGMTDQMRLLAQAAAPKDTVIDARTAPHGFAYISSLAESQIAGAICLQMLADAPPPDAAIIAAFGDPGLAAARELFDFPVIGMAEAAILTALQLGQRFAIVTFSPAMRPWYLASVAALGVGERCLGVRTPPDHAAQVADVAKTRRQALQELALAAAQDGADVVIFGGAPLAGLALEMASEIPAILVDPITAATRQALALAGTRGQRLTRPLAKASTGLPDALARRIAQQTPDPLRHS